MSQVFLEEGKVSLAVSGGDRIHKSITVQNTSAGDLDIKAYWEDFRYQPPYDGSKAFFPSGTVPESAGRWVNYSPQQFTLPSFGRQQVNYTVSVPEHIDAGHYGVLFFERSVRRAQEMSGLNVVTRVGCLFFIEPKNKIKKAEVRGLKLDGRGLRGDFINQGNVVLTPNATYHIMDEQGLVVDRGELKKLYVPPGASASWEIFLPQNLKTGPYTLVINADLEEGDVVVKEAGLVKDGSGRLIIENVRD